MDLEALGKQALQMAVERHFVMDPAVIRAGEAAILRVTRLESSVIANLAAVASAAMKAEAGRLQRLRGQQLRSQLQEGLDEAAD